MNPLYLFSTYLHLKFQKAISKHRAKILIRKTEHLTDEIFASLEKSIDKIKNTETLFKNSNNLPIPTNVGKTISLYRYLLIESCDFHIAHQQLSRASIGTNPKDRWAENFYLRVLCSLSYEFLNDAIEITGSKTNTLIESYNLNEHEKAQIKVKLNVIRKELQLIFKSHNNFLKEIRNNTIAHKNHESSITMHHIDNLDFYKSTEIFRKISHCQKLLVQFCTDLFSLDS